MVNFFAVQLQHVKARKHKNIKTQRRAQEHQATSQRKAAPFSFFRCRNRDWVLMILWAKSKAKETSSHKANTLPTRKSTLFRAFIVDTYRRSPSHGHKMTQASRPVKVHQACPLQLAPETKVRRPKATKSDKQNTTTQTSRKMKVVAPWSRVHKSSCPAHKNLETSKMHPVACCSHVHHILTNKGGTKSTIWWLSWLLSLSSACHLPMKPKKTKVTGPYILMQGPQSSELWYNQHQPTLATYNDRRSQTSQFRSSTAAPAFEGLLLPGVLQSPESFRRHGMIGDTKAGSLSVPTFLPLMETNISPVFTPAWKSCPSLQIEKDKKGQQTQWNTVQELLILQSHMKSIAFHGGLNQATWSALLLRRTKLTTTRLPAPPVAIQFDL